MALRRGFLALLRLDPDPGHRRLRALLDLVQRPGPLGRAELLARVRRLLRLLPHLHGLPLPHVRHLLPPHQHLPRRPRMGPPARLLPADGDILADGQRRRRRCGQVFDRRRGVWVRGVRRRVVVAVRPDVRVGGFPAAAAGRGFESDHQRGGAEGGVEDKIRGASGVNPAAFEAGILGWVQRNNILGGQGSNKRVSSDNCRE